MPKKAGMEAWKKKRRKIYLPNVIKWLNGKAVQVELAKAVKQRLKNKTADKIEEEYVRKWEQIFEKLND